MSLTKQQQEVFDKVTSDIKIVRSSQMTSLKDFVSITGAAGTGKTYLSKSLIESFLKDDLVIACLAPTHQAVNVIKESVDIIHDDLYFATLHSFLGIKPGKVNLLTGERKFVKDKNVNRKNGLQALNVDVLIIDECSMIGSEMLKFIEHEVYNSRRIRSILLLGDSYQLPAIEKEVNKIVSVIYDNKDIEHYKLTKLIRNPNMEVINFVTSIRDMIEQGHNKIILANFLYEESEKEHEQIVFYHSKKDLVKKFIEEPRLKNTNDSIVSFTNIMVEKYNNNIRNYMIKKYALVDNKVPELSIQDLFVVQSTFIGEERDSFYSSEVIELKAFIPREFQITLDVERNITRVFSGFKCITTGGRSFNKVSEDSEEHLQSSIEFLKNKAISSRQSNDWKNYYKLLELFLDVRYHYSGTIHKSQGSSYENIYVDCSDIDYLGDQMLLRLFYVAISRSKNKVYILL